MKPDKSYSNDISILVQNFRNNLSDEIGLSKCMAEMRKMQFDSYKAEGFTDEQALRLVEAGIKNR